MLQGYGSGLKEEEETHMTHMNVNVTSSGQGTRTVVLQIPRVRVRPLIKISTTFFGWDLAEWSESRDSQCWSRNCPGFDPSILRHSEIWGGGMWSSVEWITERKKAPKNSPFFSEYAQNFSRFLQNRKRLLDANILWKLILVTEHVQNTKCCIVFWIVSILVLKTSYE